MSVVTRSIDIDEETRSAFRQARIDLAAALRLAHRYGFSEGICNHFSYAVPGRNDLFLLNPFAHHWSEVRASDILLVDAEGVVLDGEGTAEVSAFMIHRGVHLASPRANAVLHTHMPYATALTTLEDQRLLPLHQTALRFYDDVAYDEDYRGLADEREEGETIGAALGDKRVLFLANHGVIVVGETIANAFDDLYYLERACQLQVLAYQSGKPLRLLGENIARATRAQYGEINDYGVQHFEALKRMLNREDESYAA